jgi:biotin-(acetyl-CoA carboxylase) ligase
MRPTILELQQTESTHSLCAALGPRLEGELLVLAQVQTQGRGRRGRQWVSTRGNLHASYLSSLPALALPGAPSLAGLALASLLKERYGVPCQVKWPNDVLVGDRKLAGILCAAVAGRLLVSTGVNLVEPGRIDQPAVQNLAANVVSGSDEPALSNLAANVVSGSDEPAGSAYCVRGLDGPTRGLDGPTRGLDEPAVQDLAANVVSGSDSSSALAPCWLGQFGVVVTPLELALDFVARFLELAAQVQRAGAFPVELWNQHWGHRGQRARASTPGGDVVGFLRGVDAAGALLLEADDGTLVTVCCDEVIHLRREL